MYLAQQIAADGVHLGLTDMSIKEARSILGATIEQLQIHLLILKITYKMVAII
jgi:hypothetical protein